MRIILALLVLLTAACSAHDSDRRSNRDMRTATFFDTDDDGLPDSRARGVAVFVDTDDDGLPDARRMEGHDGRMDVQRVDHQRDGDRRDNSGRNDSRQDRGRNDRDDRDDRDARIDRALQQLERAIADLRRAMHESPDRRAPNGQRAMR